MYWQEKKFQLIVDIYWVRKKEHNWDWLHMLKNTCLRKHFFLNLSVHKKTVEGHARKWNKNGYGGDGWMGTT